MVWAGDIAAKTAKEKAEKYFGNIPAGPPVAHQQVWVAKMTGTHRQVVQDRVPQPRIYKVWNIPEYGSADSVYLDLVSDILTTGKSSRFYKRLVYDDQIATDAKAARMRWWATRFYFLEFLPFPPYKTAAADADRSKAPEIGMPPQLKLPKLQRAKLSNGLSVVLAERHEVPLVSFWMTSDAGYAADEFAAPGTASMTMALLTGGTKTRSALEISDQLAMLGAELRANSNLDMSTVRLSALKSKLDPSLELFADVILNPSFPDADFKRQQKLQLAAIEREKNTPVQMALRVFPGLLYGAQHAYGNPLTGSGTSASVAKMTREDLAKFHDLWMRPNDSTLIVVGDTNLAEVTPKLEKLFAGWKAGKAPAKNIGTVQQAPKSEGNWVDKPATLEQVIIAR